MITTINQQNTQPATKVQSLSLPNVLLRLEGLTVLVAAIAAYAHQGGSIWLFLALLLAPDLSALGYLVNVRVGSISYNAVHTYTVPALLAAAAFALNMPTLLLIAFIWFAHIGMDRVMGFGLKYPTEFKDTHMQHV
ncbi:MAG: DUF4260 domain-containing protein [Chloroflexota bacterium]